jgi:hypothetical protein
MKTLSLKLLMKVVAFDHKSTRFGVISSQRQIRKFKKGSSVTRITAQIRHLLDWDTDYQSVVHTLGTSAVTWISLAWKASGQMPSFIWRVWAIRGSQLKYNSDAYFNHSLL